MTAPFKSPIQNEPKPEIGIRHYNRKSSPHGNLCVALRTATKTTTNITKKVNEPVAA